MTDRDWPDGWVPRSVFVAPPFRVHDMFPRAFALMGSFTADEDKAPDEPAFLGDLLARPLPTEPETPPEKVTASGGWCANSIAIRMDLSATHLADYGPRKAGPETYDEWAAREAEKQARAAELAEAWRLYDEALERLDHLTGSTRTRTEGPLSAVWDLHRPVLSGGCYPTCEGCDAGSYAEDAPEWPCSTVEALADALGVTLPAHHALARRPEGDDQ